MFSKITSFIFFLIFIALVSWGFQKLAVYDANNSKSNTLTYLPNESAVELVSLGYKIPVGNFLWFHTINYFGKHYQSDKDYRYLNHMCKLVTKLNPKANDVYEFCSLIVAYETSNYKQGIELLDFAIQHTPDHWRYYYLRGMLYMMFGKDPRKAQYNFAEGAKQPEAPAFLVTMAARQLADYDTPETAIEFLEDAIKNAKDQTQKKALIERRTDVIESINRNYLQKKVDEYKTENKVLPEDLKAFAQDLSTPDGGVFYLDKATGRVKNSKKK